MQSEVCASHSRSHVVALYVSKHVNRVDVFVGQRQMPPAIFERAVEQKMSRCPASFSIGRLLHYELHSTAVVNFTAFISVKRSSTSTRCAHVWFWLGSLHNGVQTPPIGTPDPAFGRCWEGLSWVEENVAHDNTCFHQNRLAMKFHWEPYIEHIDILESFGHDRFLPATARN